MSRQLCKNVEIQGMVNPANADPNVLNCWVQQHYFGEEVFKTACQTRPLNRFFCDPWSTLFQKLIWFPGPLETLPGIHSICKRYKF